MVLFKHIEQNKKLRTLELVIIALLLLLSSMAIFKGISLTTSHMGKVDYLGNVKLIRDFDKEDYDEDYTICEVTYTNGQDSLTLSYPYEEYVNLKTNEIQAFKYIDDKGIELLLDHQDANVDELLIAYKDTMIKLAKPSFNVGFCELILLLAILTVLIFGISFTLYEKIWFVSIMALACIIGIFLPEETVNGVNGVVIMLLYLLDTYLNILCELLISKQSRYNFLVSVLVEIVEIITCMILMYRFATLTVTLFFWLPIDILSFINWSKHKDDDEQELTVVRRLKGYQEVLVIIGIVIWTLIVGYVISGLNIHTDFFLNRKLETLIIYIDACASAVGIANGLFIFFRLEEQWLAWYLCAILETIINILSGQYVLLVLKLGYFTNTTYGYIKWNKYIKTHKEEHSLL